MWYALPGASGRMVRSVLGGLCAVLAVLAASGTPAAAQSDPDKPPPDEESLPAEPVPGPFESWAELLEAQERLNAAADQLSPAAERERGFTGIEASPVRGRLRLFWHGVPPEPIRDLVARLSREVPIEVLSAEHSRAELLEQQAAIAAEPGVNTVAAQVDGSGLTVGYEGSEDAARQLRSIANATVPVVVEPYDETQPAGCSGRQDDCSPFWGGAKYVMPGGGWCSTGFTLKFTWFLYPSPPSSHRMLSAGHCAGNGTAVKDGGGQPMGTITGDSDAADLLTIDPAGGFAPRVYLDSWNAGLASNKAVKAAKPSYVGNWVCPSGAATGEHCPVVVSHVDVTIWGTVKTVRANHYYPNSVAVGKGDSGGPVIVHQWWGGGVYAMGTISALSNVVPCPAGSPSPLCGSTVYYVGIMTALNHYDGLFNSVSVLTG